MGIRHLKMLWEALHQMAEPFRVDAFRQHLVQPRRHPAHVVERAHRHLQQLFHGPVVINDEGTLAPWGARVIAKVDARRLIFVKMFTMGPRKRWTHLCLHSKPRSDQCVLAGRPSPEGVRVEHDLARRHHQQECQADLARLPLDRVFGGACHGDVEGCPIAGGVQRRHV